MKSDLVLKDDINNLIYEVNGKPVMLDSDLARLYDCKNGTKEVNQAVKNNPNKFPGRFSWKLTDEETEIFLVKNFDQKKEKRGGRYKNPRVFTEEGVAMLATILKTDVAVEVSIRIMDAFVALRHYVGNNEYRLYNIESKLFEHEKNIQLLQDSFKRFEINKKTNEIFYNGQIYDAYSKIVDIFGDSKEELIIIDAYADKTMLDIIKSLNVRVILIVKTKSLLKQIDIDRYNEQYNNLELIFTDDFHDRYFILDKETVYHCGTSINKIGNRTFSISLLEDKELIYSFIRKIQEKYLN